MERIRLDLFVQGMVLGNLDLKRFGKYPNESIMSIKFW